MARYETEANTPDEFRLSLISELGRRQATARAMAAKATTAKRKQWETGRVDCYGDILEFLTHLTIKTSVQP